MLRGLFTRTRLGLVLAVAAGVVLGAVYGQPGSSQAASTAKPTNKTLPTISGPVGIGQTLTATRGTWIGKPTSFRFRWLRCDGSGAACIAISGATARIYTVTNADEAHTLRVAVTARNATGSTTATSAAVGPVPPSGCPSGNGKILMSQLSPPARLNVADATVQPSVKRSSQSIHLRFTITACGNRPVQGASVFATAIPYNQFSVGQGTTGADGTVVLTESRRSGFPASTHQRLLAVFARAWEQGQPVNGSLSSSRVVAFRFSHH
jgi:hypothetical protein